MLYIIQTTLTLGLVYSLVSLALFISYRVLDIADLSTDGCYVLGMAVSVTCAYYNHPILGIFLAIIAGILSGYVVAFLQTTLKIPSILAGIITNVGLYSINLMIMNFSSNVSLLKKETIFTLFKSLNILPEYSELILLTIVVLISMLIINWFLSTRLGLSIRATGDNKEMVASSSINPKMTISIGLMFANSFTALAGALVGQSQRSADINAGTGIVVIGLTCLIIGERLLNGQKSIPLNIIACLVGNIIYRLIYAIIIQTRIFPVELLKLITAIILIIAIASPTLKEEILLMKKRRESQ